VSRRLRSLGALPFLVLGLTACGAGSVDADDVATGAEDALEKQVGARPDVTCPEDLEAEVGAKTRCTLTAEGLDGEYGVSVTVTAVDGDDVNYDVLVDDEPTGGGQ
jgi:hypothetical protein